MFERGLACNYSSNKWRIYYGAELLITSNRDNISNHRYILCQIATFANMNLDPFIGQQF